MLAPESLQCPDFGGDAFKLVANSKQGMFVAQCPNAFTLYHAIWWCVAAGYLLGVGIQHVGVD